jgi:hypothetical protein
MKTKIPVSKLDKISFKDWLLLLISLLFTLGGLVLLKSNFNLGITTIAFFGGCLAVAISTILGKLRAQKYSSADASVTGGTPIRPARARFVAIGLGLFVIGSIFVKFQPDDDQTMFVIALFIAATGAIVLVSALTGLLSRNYIQFDPPGITFGFWGGKAIVPWSAITDLARGEMQSNQAVFLRVHQQAVSAEPLTYLAKIQKQMSLSQALTGAEFFILSSNYAIDAPMLFAVIERYVNHPEFRAELAADQQLSR